MEKPVRIAETEKIRNFNEKVRNGLEHAINFMLGGEDTGIQISYFEPFLMPIEAYVQAYKKQSVLIRLFSDHDYKGELYWFFETNTALVLASMMRMIPAVTIEEKLKVGTFDAADQDAFGEVGNQLSGILDRAFRTLTRKNIHLRMDFNKITYPSDNVKFVNAEEYVVLLATLTIPKYTGQKLTLLLPRSLYETMLNLEISLEDIHPKKVMLHSCAEAVLEKVQTAMNSRYTKVLVCEQAEDLIKAVDQPGLSAVGIHLQRPTFPLQHVDAIFIKRLATSRPLSRLPYFLTWDNATDAEVAEVVKMGLTGATTKSIDNFTQWVSSFTQDPSKKT